MDDQPQTIDEAADYLAKRAALIRRLGPDKQAQDGLVDQIQQNWSSLPTYAQTGLAGAGLGALGSGLTNYFGAEDEEDRHPFQSALTGALAGGGLGAGLGAVGQYGGEIFGGSDGQDGQSVPEDMANADRDTLEMASQEGDAMAVGGGLTAGGSAAVHAPGAWKFYKRRHGTPAHEFQRGLESSGILSDESTRLDEATKKNLRGLSSSYDSNAIKNIIRNFRQTGATDLSDTGRGVASMNPDTLRDVIRAGQSSTDWLADYPKMRLVRKGLKGGLPAAAISLLGLAGNQYLNPNSTRNEAARLLEKLEQNQ